MFTKSKNNFFAISILLIFCSELFVHPFFQFLSYGLGFDISPSYFLRFNYLIISFLGLCLVIKKLKLPNLSLIKVFAVFFVIGLTKGIFNDNFYNYSATGSNIFLSHIFYLVHPILSITLGFEMYNSFFKNKRNFSSFSRLLKFSFIFGLILAILFQTLSFLGIANYSSVDIWNVFYGGSFMLSTSNSIVLPFIVILKAIFLGKRITMLIAILFAIIYLLRNSLKKLLIYLIPISIVLIIFVSNFDYKNFGGIKRLNYTLELINDKDLNSASAGRLIEATRALEILSSSNSNLFFGTGFGSFFYPWPDWDASYTSHYTHFTPVSYMWIGGLFLTIIVYWSLISLAVSLFKLKHLKNSTQARLFQLLIPAIITASIFGAVLMNNSLLWFIVGMAYKLIDEDKLIKLKKQK